MLYDNLQLSTSHQAITFLDALIDYITSIRDQLDSVEFRDFLYEMLPPAARLLEIKDYLQHLEELDEKRNNCVF